MLLSLSAPGLCCRHSKGWRRSSDASSRSLLARSSRSETELQLKRWIQQNGGFVHESLSLTDHAPCGVRGVIATASISFEDVMERELVSVPKSLHFENAAAAQLLKARLKASAADLVDQLEQIQVVAAALALERSIGASSSWSPYLATLPDVPPGPWLMPPRELETAIGLLREQQRRQGQGQASADLGSSSLLASALDAGIRRHDRGRDHDHDADLVGASSSGSGSSAGWAEGDLARRVQSCRAHYEDLAAEVLDLCGSSLGIGADDLLWALGQVSSRSLGSGRSSGLVPFMDLLNHGAEARPPMLQLNDDDKLVMTCTNIRQGELQGMEAGQELYISYGEWESPLQAWLKFGFVPS